MRVEFPLSSTSLTIALVVFLTGTSLGLCRVVKWILAYALMIFEVNFQSAIEAMVTALLI